MGFLAPWFLGGLALIGVPLLVHLTRRDKATPSPFPSLMFVRRLPQPTTRRRRLRDLPLLALRVLALVLLAAAFARPLLDRARAAVPGAGGRELVVLLDRSYSMGAPGRWARAQDAARQAVAALGPNDRGTVVYFDASAVVAAERAPAAALRAAVDTAKVGAGPTRYAPALALASRLLGASPLSRREALVVSDFQRAGWRESAAARLPAGARLTWADVGGTAPNDVAVAAVDLRREGGGPAGERVAAVARLVMPSGAAARAVPVTLAVNGRDVQRVTARVGPGAAASVAFEPVPVPPGWSRATVRVEPDAIPADDAFHFTFARGQSLRALLVRGASRDPNGELYLRRALGVGDAPPIGVDLAPAASLGATLAGHAVVLLHDAPVRGAAAQALAAWVRAGGGLVIALGDASAPEAWDPAIAELLPARPGAVVDRPDGMHVATYERGHPVFVPFAAPHSGDLGAPRVLRRRAVTPAPDAQVLARFDDGAPALVERAAGRGRVLLWASTLDAWWTDLPLDPVFVPLVRGLAVHAARFVPAAPSYAVGQTLDPAALLGAESTAWVVETPGGKDVRLAPDAASLAVLTEPGFYRVRPDGSPPDAGALVAANVDAAEADTARVAPAEIERAVTEPAGAPVSGSGTVETRAEREARQSLWWYLLVTMLVLLVAETLVANRRPRLAR